MNFNQRTIIHVVIKYLGEVKIDCQNCNQPIRNHDADSAHDCLELTSLLILSQRLNNEGDKEITVPVA